MELKLQIGGKKADDQTLIGDVNSLGGHLFTDKFFADRGIDIQEYFSNYLSEDDIDAMGVSDIRKRILKQAMKSAKHVMYQSMFGKGAERPRFLRAVHAVNDLLLSVQEFVDTDADDADVNYVCRDVLSQFPKVPPATFDSQNTAINKSFFIPPTGIQTNTRPEDKPSSSTGLTKIAQQQREARQKEEEEAQAAQ